MYQVGKCNASVTYGKTTYKLIGVDSYALTDNSKDTRIFPKDGSGPGIKQSTGKDQADSITLTATYLPAAVENLLNTIHDDTTGYCTLTITDTQINTSGSNNRTVLDFATVESKVYQKQIDDTAGGKYSIVFNGKFKKSQSSYDAG